MRVTHLATRLRVREIKNSSHNAAESAMEEEEEEELISHTRCAHSLVRGSTRWKEKKEKGILLEEFCRTKHSGNGNGAGEVMASLTVLWSLARSSSKSFSP